MSLPEVFVFVGAYPWLIFLLALFASWLFCRIATPVFFGLLSVLSSKTKSDFDDKLFKIIEPAVSKSLFFVLVYFSFLFSKPVEQYEAIVLKLILTIVLIIWAKPLTRLSALILHQLSLRKNSFVKKETLALFKNISFVIIWSLLIYFAFLLWGISLTAWLASAGIVGIAVGFAAKDTLANLISGIFILADAPYKVGDIIVLDTNEKGEVIHVGLRSTRVRTFDGVEITIPNSTMGNSKIINETGVHVDKKVRLRIPVSISYEDDIDRAEEILLNIANDDEFVCEDPKAQVRFLAFGASSLDLELRVWVKEPADRGRTLDRLNRKILNEFRSAHIEIPYNKMDIYIKEHESGK